jgi:arylsulfatase A-like enzyme
MRCATKPEQVNNSLPGKPNVVFILANHLSAKDLGCYGQKNILTPNIDSLAALGTRFNNYRVVNEINIVNREIVLFGDINANTVNPNPAVNHDVPKDTLNSLAQIFKSAGYATGIYGIWGFGGLDHGLLPEHGGFNDFVGYYTMEEAKNTFPEYLFCDKEKIQLGNVSRTGDIDRNMAGAYSSDKIDYSNDIFFREAIRFIKTNKDTSFFLFLPFAMPQANPLAPEGLEYEVPDLSPYNHKSWSEKEKAYAAMVTRLDIYIGKIRDQLIKSGIDKNTLVIFTATSPALPHVRDKNQVIKKQPKPGADVKQHKVPLLVVWPNVITSKAASNYSCSTYDIYPTILDLAGLGSSFKGPGNSLLPELLKRGNPIQLYINKLQVTIKLVVEPFFFKSRSIHCTPETKIEQGCLHGIVASEING